MMSKQYTLFVSDTAWRVGVSGDDAARLEPVECSEGAHTPADRVEATCRVLDELEYAGEAVMLAVDSAWCLCATIQTTDLGRGARRRAMNFQLEEHLPMSAEHFVADYVQIHQGQILGVACETDRLRPIIDACSARGILIQHVCPRALLAAARVAEDVEHANGILLTHAGHHDLIMLHERNLTQWNWFADDRTAMEHDLLRCIESSDRPLSIVSFSDGKPRFDTSRELNWIDWSDREVDEACMEASGRILQGASTPWIDLRRDELAAPGQYQAYRKPVGALVAAAVLLLISLSVVIQWRGRQYDAMRQQYLSQQVEVFKEALPDQRVPAAGIKRRLQSEQRKLAGLGGQAAADSQREIQTPRSALEQLHDVLSSLPAGLRFRILDLSIEPDRIRIEGQSRSHAEAEQLTAALRATGRYEVEPPKTQALKDKGVSFVFLAKPRERLAVAKGESP